MEVIRWRTSGAWLAGVVVAACAAAAPAVAHAEQLVDNSGGAITIASQAIGSPYPSTIRVLGGDGDIADVNVRVTLSHTSPDDIDLVIVPPDGSSITLMTDACGLTALSNVTFTFNQQVGSTLSDDGPCATGTFKPTDFDIGQGDADNWPAPGPGTSAGAANLDTQNGHDPNGNWQLFVLDDNVNDSGSIASWGLTITTETGEVIIPAGPASSGIASPYPSVKSVPTPDGEVISDVNVGISQFHHLFPADVDALLQGPGGQAVMVVSDACSDLDLQGIDWLFDEDFGTPLPITSDPSAINFVVKPTDYGDPESLPAPAPQRPYEASLDAFDGLPGGDFRLFVNDDTGGDTGYINAWDVEVKTRPVAETGFTATAVATAEGQTTTLTVTRTATSTLGPATLGVDIGHSGTDPADIGSVPAQLQFARGETSKTIEIPINDDFEGEGAENFAVSLTDPTGDARVANASSFVVVTIAASLPDNRFTVGEVKRLPNGSATVEVTIPNPGTLSSQDAGPKELLKPTETDASSTGKNVITVKPAKRAKRKLKRGKKVSLTAEITYTPYDGVANSAETPVTLKRQG
jgi:subtilisin-like proprotein convertase family protein